MFLSWYLVAFSVALCDAKDFFNNVKRETSTNGSQGEYANIIEKAFIIEFNKSDETAFGSRDSYHSTFHKRAASITYDIRHQFDSTTFTGLSISVTQSGTNEEVQRLLADIPGVAGVWPVYQIPHPGMQNNVDDSSVSTPPETSPILGRRQSATASGGDLASSLEMGGVDKLHAKGIKGKGIKIGIIDTGVDYRHPALGGGFGPGFKIAGGYSFVNDNGTLTNGPDPLTTCISGGHGTHVTGKLQLFLNQIKINITFLGIIGMNPLSGSDGFPITGVAPEASLYMYRTFDCSNAGGSDTVMAGMLKAQSDGVNIISMSLSVGTQYPNVADPLASVVQSMTKAGIAVVVAIGNEASLSQYATELYSADYPSTEPGAIAVGAISNKDFPLVYPAVDSVGSSIGYASVWPLKFTGGAHVYLLSDGCDPSVWSAALDIVSQSGLINNTIFAFEAFTSIGYCNPNSISSSWNSANVKPLYVMGYNSAIANPYLLEYNVFSASYFGTIRYINLNTVDGQTLVSNYGTSGGFPKYTLNFTSNKYSSPTQHTAGQVDYYSNFGPAYFTYDLKPQISAPGGHILSTYPLGSNSNYTILSGTSMATPYIAACYALVKSQLPAISPAEILSLLQTTASPVSWVWDSTILSATAQQGAGLVNAYAAISASSRISPGQIVVGDDPTHTKYGATNVTIQNTSGRSKTYTLSHLGAGYTDGQLSGRSNSQTALYGSAIFPTSSVTIQAGKSLTVPFTIVPPPAASITPSHRPVFGGYIKVSSSASETYTVPYIGAPYSLFNASYISVIQVAGFTSEGLPQIDKGFLEVNPAFQYGIAADIPLQNSLSFRFDLLPANTSIAANTYGFNVSAQAQPVPGYVYTPSKQATRAKIFGQSSYGTYTRQGGAGVVVPGNYIQYWTNGQVQGDDGTVYEVGDGDYRFYASVLRWGATVGSQRLEDYDTWLGPVLRFNSSIV
jgi:subtilisin family serine protease